MEERGVAVIVEPRKHPALKFAVESVLEKVPNWDIVLMHGVVNSDWVKHLLKHYSNRVRFRLISPGCQNLSIEEYNRLLTSVHFYESFGQFEYVLIFQSDSMLLQRSPYSIGDFIGWDYVGAPWSDKPTSPGGNGGLSLRRVQSMINVCRRFPFPRGRGLNEDVYFARKKLSFAPRHVATQFSFESMFVENQVVSFGCHKPWEGLSPTVWQKVCKSLPEVYILATLQSIVRDEDSFKSDDRGAGPLATRTEPHFLQTIPKETRKTETQKQG